MAEEERYRNRALVENENLQNLADLHWMVRIWRIWAVCGKSEFKDLKKKKHNIVTICNEKLVTKAERHAPTCPGTAMTIGPRVIK